MRVRVHCAILAHGVAGEPSAEAAEMEMKKGRMNLPRGDLFLFLVVCCYFFLSLSSFFFFLSSFLSIFLSIFFSSFFSAATTAEAEVRANAPAISAASNFFMVLPPWKWFIDISGAAQIGRASCRERV